MSGRSVAENKTPFRRWVEVAEKEAAKGRLEMGIPMRDGIELAADIYMPFGYEYQSLPVIVEVTPYNKDNVTLISSDVTLYQTTAISSSPLTAAVVENLRATGRVSRTTCPTRTTSSSG